MCVCVCVCVCASVSPRVYIQIYRVYGTWDTQQAQRALVLGETSTHPLNWVQVGHMLHSIVLLYVLQLY